MSAQPSPETLILSNGIVDVGLAMRYGPRVVHYGWAGGENRFAAAPGATRQTPDGVWRAYGGHRLWAAPERFPETYTIDDAPPVVERIGAAGAHARRARDPRTMLVASITVELAGGADVVVRHTIANEGGGSQTIAPWGITVMPCPGTAVIPNAIRRPQREALLPVRTVALWRYTDLNDARIRFGPRFMEVRCDPAIAAPSKIGVACERGWFAYVAGDAAFVVQTPYDSHARYPDLGSSVEVYVEGGYCEVESLAPLRVVPPGGRAEHVERWSLLPIGGDITDDALAAALAKHVGE